MPKITFDSKVIILSKSTLLIIIILLLLALNVVFVMKYSNFQKELKIARQALESQESNDEVLDFTKLFINKVLKAEGEIDFETRLQLENSVRILDDTEILAQWQEFIGSETEVKAQQEVKNLLELLVSKIK